MSNRVRSSFLLLAFLAVLGIGCGSGPGGLKVKVLSPGNGAQAKAGQLVTVHYTGWVKSFWRAKGTKFDSSVDRGQPIRFLLGTGRVIPGWDQGLAMMKVGEKALFTIPPALAYGPSGRPPTIPANATLVFEVELVGADDPKPEIADLKVEVLKKGKGATAVAGRSVTVHYTGWLLDGTKFDSSVDRGQPFTFQLGQGQVIQGWDKGVAGMKVGEKRKLTIPSRLAYGEQGAGGAIPPFSTLVFEVELLGVAAGQGKK